MRPSCFLATWLLLCACSAAQIHAQAPVKQIPPPGNELTKADRAELEAGVASLGHQIDALREDLEDRPHLLALLPDVQIYHNAVRYPLVHRELCDVNKARHALRIGGERAAQLRDGNPAWLNVSGPRGYVSRIDDSVQPYILLVPPSHTADTNQKHRLDFWCHGRDEKLTELNFISGKIDAVADRFQVNLYGRYCNANKFAGEIDLLEAFDDVKKRHPIDETRVVISGFSMGGAACWHFAVHYTDLFAAAAPGAGFAETRRYLKLGPREPMPPWYVQKLWRLYDCTDYAANLAQLPTVAYSGELDPQKQAADVMAAAMKDEGLSLVHLIGPQTKHEYHKETKRDLDARINEMVAKGRHPVPQKIRFTTFTLRYNRMYWVNADALERHWDRARIDAEVIKGEGLRAKTQNVSELTFSFPPGHAPFNAGASVTIDGTMLQSPAPAPDRSWTARFVKERGTWRVRTPAGDDAGLRKRHALQGPIDDAFLDRFIFVAPTGEPMNPRTGAWYAAELAHAADQWRKLFRGEPLLRRDTDVTDADIASSNLVLFGDPSSNRLISRVSKQLPIQWTSEHVRLGDRSFASANHVPVLIYPNPLNPKRYVVLNSGFTFREADHLSNARQIPKLPDYAVIDLDEPITPRAPGRVAAAGFFGERWQLLPDDGRSDFTPLP